MQLQHKIFERGLVLVFVFLCNTINLTAQDNSPISRFGLGDKVPSTHQVLRAMGGVSTGIGNTVTNGTFVNTANPASYAFLAYPTKTKRIGRTILDIGVDYQNHGLRSTSPSKKYNSNSLIFSYIQVGIPLDTPQRWGLVFGLKPYSNISFNVVERIRAINSNNPSMFIDSFARNFEGSGGAYQGYIGTGYRIGNMSLGINTGYIFGKKNFASRNVFINDSLLYYPGNFENKVNFGNVFYETGLLYTQPLAKNQTLTLGATYNAGVSMKATRDIIKETYFVNNVGEIDSLDRLIYLSNQKGTIKLPNIISVGVTYERTLSDNINSTKPAFLVSAQYETTQFSNYSFYGSNEGLVNSNTIRVGGYFLNPYRKNNRRQSLFTNMIYRGGFYTTRNSNGLKGLNQSAFTLGFGVPVSKDSWYSTELSFLNVSMEIGQRKGFTNFKENFFKLGLGFSLSDIWFVKRKYN
jgi:hypothetical protein